MGSNPISSTSTERLKMAYIYDDRGKSKERVEIEEVLRVHDGIAFVWLEDHSHAMINLKTREVVAFDYDFYLVSDDFDPPRF